MRAWMLADCKSYVHKMILSFDCLCLDWIAPQMEGAGFLFFKVGIPRHARFSLGMISGGSDVLDQ
jgi:hypothetical protein